VAYCHTCHAHIRLLIFLVVTQQIATFWGVGIQAVSLRPQIRTLARFFCTMHLKPSFVILSLIVRKLSCWQINRQTDKQTNRRHWKHPPRSAMIRRWVMIISLCYHQSIAYEPISAFNYHSTVAVYKGVGVYTSTAHCVFVCEGMQGIHTLIYSKYQHGDHNARHYHHIWRECFICTARRHTECELEVFCDGIIEWFIYIYYVSCLLCTSVSVGQ